MRNRERAPRALRVAETRGAQLLREWLEADEGRTQVKLAAQLGVKQTTISTWLGKMRPSYPRVLEVERITKIPVAAWWERLGEKKRSSRTRKAA